MLRAAHVEGNPMKPLTVIVLILFLLVAGVVGLFGYQNLATQVDLVFALPMVGGWYLAKGFPVPYLLGIVFGAGFLLAFLWFGVRAMSAGRRAANLQKRVDALEDELQWAKRNSSKSTSARPAPKAAPKPVPVAPKAEPKSAPAAADPPDFDDLI